MNIYGLTVCVDYADLLARGIARWRDGMERLVVVTSTADKATQELCFNYRVETHVTDIFYANGAKFNKGAALSEAVIAKGYRNDARWLCTFDADIVPPLGWKAEVERATPSPGKLYGARRYWMPEDAKELKVDYSRRMPQGWVLGFFSLFHTEDLCLPKGPLFDVHWPHAGNYDTTFCRLWPENLTSILPINMIHLGEERQNWCGRHKKADLQAVLAERKKMEDWNRERMANPPKVDG